MAPKRKFNQEERNAMLEAYIEAGHDAKAAAAALREMGPAWKRRDLPRSIEVVYHNQREYGSVADAP